MSNEQAKLVPFPLAELLEPRLLVLVESHDRKVFVQVKLSREQYDNLERILGVDPESIARTIEQRGVLPLRLGFQAVLAGQFEKMAGWY